MNKGLIIVYKRLVLMVSDYRKFWPWSIAWNSNIRTKLEFVYNWTNFYFWVWPLMYIGGIFFTTFQPLNMPLLWRSFNYDSPRMYLLEGLTKGYANHHTLNLLATGFLTIFLALYYRKKQGGRFVRWGVLAAYGSILTWAVHESFWWITYSIEYYPNIELKWFAGFGEIICVGIFLLTPALGLFTPKRYIAFMIILYGAWIAMGFPITVSYTGNTPLYDSALANFWEVFSWVAACIAYYFLEKDKSLEWWNKKIQLVNRFKYAVKND